MTSVKALERIVFVMDEIKAFAEIKGLPLEIYLPDKKASDAFSQDDYQGVVSLLFDEKILSEEEMFHREHMPVEQYFFAKINYKKFDEFYEKVAGRIKELNPSPVIKETPIKEAISGVSFEEESGLLKIGDYSIKINPKTFAHNLLSFFKNDFTKEADYFEIAKYIDYTDDEDIKKYYKDKYYLKIYRACKDVQEKIQRATKFKIDEFLIFDSKKTGSVKINEKYLKPQT